MTLRKLQKMIKKDYDAGVEKVFDKKPYQGT